MNTLLILQANYADEFDLESFCIVDTDAWDGIKKVLSRLDQDEDIEVYFGTNEYVEITIGSFLEDVIERPLSETEEIFLLETFGDSFGTLYISSIIESILEKNEDTEGIEELLKEFDLI